MTDTFDVLSAEDASKLLRCSIYTVVEHAKRGKLPALKFGDGWIFPRKALVDRVNAMAVESAGLRMAGVKPTAGPAPRSARKRSGVLDLPPIGDIPGTGIYAPGTGGGVR